MSADFAKLEDVAEVIDSLHKTPEYSEVGYPMVRCTDVKYGPLSMGGTLKVDASVFAEFSRRYKPQQNDIIITRVGSYGNMAHVVDTNFCLGQNTAAIVPKINPRFLYFALNSPQVKRQIEFSVVGSTQKTLSLKAINNLDIPRFDPSVEERIAEIVGSIDDKIELNRQINQTLEQIAQTIFKSWFVDFEPVKAKIEAKAAGRDPERAAMCAISGKLEEELSQLSPEQYQQIADTAALFPDELVESELGLIPQGWRASQIGDEVIATGGGTPSTQVSEYWENGTYYWATPRDFSNLSDKVLLATERKITKEGLSKISSGLLPAGTVLMSSRAPVGYLAITKIPTAVNQGFIAMKCNKDFSPEFCLQWAHHMMDDIKQRASGTTFAEISKSNFRQIPVVVPSKRVMDSYTITVSGLYELIASNAAESTALSETRNSLLPKLLSGELSIEGDMNG